MANGDFGLLSPAFGNPSDRGHSTPTPSSSFPHSGLSLHFSPDVSAMRPFPGNGLDIAQMKLTDLFVNPYVEDLFNKWTNANSKATRYIEEQHQMIQQINSLQNELFMLRDELAVMRRKLEEQGTSAPMRRNDTIMPSQPPNGVKHGSSGRIERPERLPPTVLWLLDDTRKYELTSKSNKSRPKMELCVRREDGSIISSAEYSALLAVVRRLVALNLSSLATPKDPAAASTPRTRRWYRKWYPQNYQDLLTRLEDAEPLLALCAGSWKGDHLVGRHLLWLADQAKKEEAQTGQKRTFNADDTALDFEEEWDTEQLEGNVGGTTKESSGSESISKKRRKTSMGKDKENEAPQRQPASKPRASVSPQTPSLPRVSLETQLATLGQSSQTLRTANSVSTDAQSVQVSEPPKAGGSAIDSGPQTSESTLCEPLDIRFIQIEKTASSLRREFLVDFVTLKTVVYLLDAMEANPHFGNSTTAPEVLGFIDVIENADPNSADFLEDETNAQWGHKQLSGTWKGVLTGWDVLGSCEVAFRLLAALLRTCRVARYICSERRVRAASFLSDVYLEQIVDHLWGLWTAAGGPTSKGKEKEIRAPITSASSAATSTSTSLAGNKLTKEQLRALMDSHGIKSSSRKAQPSKPEYITDILDAPISSTEVIFAEVQSILDKRPPRGGRSKDATKP